MPTGLLIGLLWVGFLVQRVMTWWGQIDWEMRQ